MRTLCRVFVLMMCGVSTSINAEAINLSFKSPIQFEYARDGFEVKTIAETATHQKIASSTLVFESSVNPVACGEQQCYPTGLDGIGVALSIDGQNVTAAPNQLQTISLSGNLMQMTAKLVVNERLSSGTYRLANVSLPTLRIGDHSLPINISPVTVEITQKTCNLVTQQHRHIQLRTISVAELAEKREVFGEKFNIALRCDPNVKADVVFRDHNDISNEGYYLTLIRPESTANGVGIAIIRDDKQKVKFGETWRFSTDVEQPNREFSAFYVRTDGVLSAGKIKAMATISFSYH